MNLGGYGSSLDAGLGGAAAVTERIIVLSLDPDTPRKHDHVTELEPGCPFDSGSDVISRSSRASSGSSSSSSNCCDRLCTNVSVVSDLVERTTRRDIGAFNDGASSLVSPGDLSAVFDSDSEQSAGGHIQPWRPPTILRSRPAYDIMYPDSTIIDTLPYEDDELTPGADEDIQSPLPLQDPVAFGDDVTPQICQIAGYEGVISRRRASVPTLITPPACDDSEVKRYPVRLPEEDMSSVGYISEESAQEALVEYVSRCRCYGSSAAREMDIYRIVPSCALHYTLETFTENRSTSWDQEPYKGQPIDGPGNGPAPQPWDIRCNPTQTFHSEVRFLEVPHSATIACCYSCASLGWSRCPSCLGRGFKRCISCCGSGRLWKTDLHGRRHVDSCWHCHGTGRRRCTKCNGDGRVVCSTCQGYRNLKCFIKLRVEYKNAFSEHVIERTDLPKQLIKNVSGECILDQTQPKIWPITDYPEEELCVASQHLVQQHLNRSRSARVLMQRHRLRVIAVSECLYSWADVDGRFWVYGREMAVHAPDYPQKHCWGCTII